MTESQAATETTPLLPTPTPSDNHSNGAIPGDAGIDSSKQSSTTSRILNLWKLDVEKRVLLAGFLITLSFSFTQVPIFYVFYIMECDAYYATHPPFVGIGNRCSRDAIAGATAQQVAILGMSTTICGTFNLFVAGWMVKRFGPRFTLFLQTFVPAIRVVLQILGVIAGGQTGIAIFQATQLITMIGGPYGYILVINIMVSETVEPIRRTAVFGMLQGCFMLGQAIGYLSGGLIGDSWGVVKPFQVAFFSFLIATLYARFALPYIPPEAMSDGKKPPVKGFAGFLAPLKVLSSQTVRLETGITKKHYGVVFLCAGVFLGVLATDYAPLLIQMYATYVFNFSQNDNGFVMSGWAFCRALFLLFLFPRIISSGRNWYHSRHPSHSSVTKSLRVEAGCSQVTGLPTRPEEFESPIGANAGEEPIGIVPDAQVQGTSAEADDLKTGFDLFFLRYSLVLDGALTMCAAFATEKWHIYLAAFMLPFASGSAPAAKGVMVDMCSRSERTDALNALTLVENIARLCTQGLFGFVFAALAQVGKPHLTFYCNAAIALIATGVLLFSNFPPAGSTLVEEENQAGSLVEDAPLETTTDE
ncbi:major facilitator superfamily domain-containing protein [Bombardia bombarda]|uniref:Major facilitator superfamily domain-containing protein n=1 Tax=Bombardia bombarda TaxID=252184 RepID=A0AA39XJK6_9PEZI|nr:major facilitator superfamily domain-containing protein [Bombardia bombarda]